MILWRKIASKMSATREDTKGKGLSELDITYAQGRTRIKRADYKSLEAQVIKRSNRKMLDMFIFRIEYPNGSNEFDWIPYDLLPLVMTWTQDKTCSFHELILGPWRRFFMDIESEIFSVKGAVKVAKEAIKAVYGEDIRVIITSASDEDKSSYHIVCPNLVFGSNEELVQAVDLILEHADDDKLNSVVDRQVFKDKTQLRIYNSYKRGKRPFVLKEELSDPPERLSDMFITTPNMTGVEGCTVIGTPKDYVETLSSKKLDSSTLKKIKRLGIEVHELPGNRVHFVGDCPICKRHHDSDNAKVTEYATGVYIYCFRAGSGKFFSEKDRRSERWMQDEEEDL